MMMMMSAGRKDIHPGSFWCCIQHVFMQRSIHAAKLILGAARLIVARGKAAQS
jgi:hypothetical protein